MRGLDTNFTHGKLLNKIEFWLDDLFIFSTENREQKTESLQGCILWNVFRLIHIRGGSCKGMRQRRVKFCSSHDLKHNLCSSNMHMPCNTYRYSTCKQLLTRRPCFLDIPIDSKHPFFLPHSLE